MPHGRHKDPIGEIWFDAPPPLSEILAKYLFTGEKLSVQVHPTPTNSPTGTSKDECWLVTEARPDAILAVGFRKTYELEEIEAAALSGSISHMLEWRAARKDDFYYVPSGTVHAIGPGLTLVEVQQNSDITHRLYDYGRPRALHLGEALRSLIPGPYDEGLRRRVSPGRTERLVEGPYFALDHVSGQPDDVTRGRMDGPVQILPLSGHCTIGDDRLGSVESGWASSVDEVDWSENDRALVVSRASASAVGKLA